jgi:hypothetical protein
MKQLLFLLLLLSFNILSAQQHLDFALKLSPLNISFDGNQFKMKGDNFSTLTTYHQNTWEYGIAARYTLKNKFGFQLGTSIKNYKLEYSYHAPISGRPANPFSNRLLYQSEVDINMYFWSLDADIYYVHKKISFGIGLEFNQPFHIKGTSIFSQKYNEDTGTTEQNYGVTTELESIFVSEKFSLEKEMPFYIIPKVNIEYPITSYLDVYSSLKFKWFSKESIHTINTTYENFIEDTAQEQEVNVFHRFFSISFGVRLHLGFNMKK